jgi:hypothetical protein
MQVRVLHWSMKNGSVAIMEARFAAPYIQLT